MKKKTKQAGPAAWLRENKWTCAVLAAALVLLIVGRLLVAPARVEAGQPEERADYESAVVEQVLSDSTEKDPAADNGYRGEQLLLVTVKSGDYQGQQMQVYNYVGPLYGGPLHAGDRATILISSYSDGTVNATVYEFDRLIPLVIVVALFIAAAVIVGGRTGAKSLVALAVTLVCLFGVLLPALMKGANTLLMTFIVCAYVAVVSLTIVGGVQKKTVCAMLGAVRAAGPGPDSGERPAHRGRGAFAAAAPDRHTHRPAGPAGRRHHHQRPGGGDGCDHGHRLLPGGGPRRQSPAVPAGAVPLRYEHRPGHGGHHDQHPDPGVFGQRVHTDPVPVLPGAVLPPADELGVCVHGGGQRHSQQRGRDSVHPADGPDHRRSLYKRKAAKLNIRMAQPGGCAIRIFMHIHKDN